MILKHLISIRLQSVLSGLTAHDRGSGTRKAGRGAKASVAVLFVFVFAVFLLLFAQVFLTLRDPFVQSGMGWLYFGFMGLMVFLLGFIGSVFLTQTQLFESKDNELLLSMPISPRTILASRLLSLLGINYLYELLIALPCGIVYCMEYRVSAGGVILFLLSCLLLPLLVLTCSALFGWIIAAVSSRMRRKNIVTMVLTIVLFLGYMYFCFRWQYYIERLAASGEMLTLSARHFRRFTSLVQESKEIPSPSCSLQRSALSPLQRYTRCCRSASCRSHRRKKVPDASNTGKRRCMSPA